MKAIAVSVYDASAQYRLQAGHSSSRVGGPFTRLFTVQHICCILKA
jgi:hypothetical protein